MSKAPTPQQQIERARFVAKSLPQPEIGEWDLPLILNELADALEKMIDTADLPDKSINTVS